MTTAQDSNDGTACPLDGDVMHKTSEELIDRLATMLGIASGSESSEERWNDEVFRRRVLRKAITELGSAWKDAEHERVKRTVLKITTETLEQIAATPRNKGARLNASASLTFLRTQGLL